MKYEIDLVQPYTQAAVPPGVTDVPPALTLHARKMLNVAGNEAIHTGLLANDYRSVALKLCLLMKDTARVIVMFNQVPEVEDLVHAGAELLTKTRSEMDRALSSKNYNDVRICAVMTELVVRGLSSTLGLPYQQLMEEVCAAEKEGRPADIEPILIRCGLVTAPASGGPL